LPIGCIDMPDLAVGASVVGDLIYVADASSGLRVYPTVFFVPEPEMMLTALLGLVTLVVIRFLARVV